MSFDQNMIIDATRGSIARFVNHSCEPNCRMVKWIVAGKPRMALFAGDNPIMSGEELTYDYNFDPFSAKNVQECRCGAETCRGVLGPRPKDKPKPVMSIGKSLKRAVNAGKRKLGELLLGEKETGGSPKRRKIIAATKTKNSTKVIPAVKELSRGLSNALKSATKGRRSTTLVRRESTKARILTTYGSANRRVTKQTFFSSSRTSSLTLVNDIPSIGKKSGKGKAIQKDSDSEGIASNLVSSPRKRTLSTKGEELQRIHGKNSPKGRKR
jgi:histone-lysine N-methyltransferase ASH1L